MEKGSDLQVGTEKAASGVAKGQNQTIYKADNNASDTKEGSSNSGTGNAGTAIGAATGAAITSDAPSAQSANPTEGEKVVYAGITNNFARRAAEQLAEKGIHIERLMENLRPEDARAVEQVLIEIHGLPKYGGTLINRINSIAISNPKYAKAIERGYELLKSIGYK